MGGGRDREISLTIMVGNALIVRKTCNKLHYYEPVASLDAAAFGDAGYGTRRVPTTLKKLVSGGRKSGSGDPSYSHGRERPYREENVQ